MRIGALALLLLMASCGQGDRADEANQAEAVPGVGGPQSGVRAAPTVTIAATGPGGCAASWGGEAVTPEQIRDRASALVMHAIERAGGAQNLTEDTIPILTVEAPAGLSFACADTILFALQRAGMVSVRLRPAGGQAAVVFDFPLDTNAPPPPIPTVLGIGAGGQLTWNDEPIDATRLVAELGRIGGSPGDLDPMSGPPPGGLEVRVGREATFGQVHDLLRTTRRHNLRPFVFLPSGEAAPAPPPAAPPPR